jgi:hypothetical protein
MIDYITVISPDAADLNGGCKESHLAITFPKESWRSN